MNKISLIVIEDHPLFRQGIVDVLSLEADIDVIASTSSGEEGLQLIRELNPQVAVVDVNLPGINGQQIVRQLVDNRITTRVILLTGYDDVEQKIYAMRSGAAGFCTKNIQPGDLINCIRHVAAGRFVLDARVMDEAGLREYLNGSSQPINRINGNRGEPVQPLSAREMEVLSLVTQGMSNKEIARSLNISQQTVKNHVTSVLRKLGLEDRTQAAIFAVQQGWVRLHKPQTNRQE